MQHLSRHRSQYGSLPAYWHGCRHPARSPTLTFMRWSSRTTSAASVAAAICVAAAMLLAAAEPNATTWSLAALGGTVAVVTVVLGVVVTRLAVDKVVGTLLTLSGAALAFTVARLDGWQYLGAHTQLASRLAWLVALLAESSIWLLVLLCLLLLYFPDGRLPGPRWRPVPAVLVGAGLIHHFYGALDRAPYAAP